MSLYHHFPSKGHLLDAVCDRLMTMVTIPPREAGDWEMRLRESILSYRAVARAHPRAFLLMATRRFNTPGALWVLDRLLEIFADAGFDPQMRARAFRILGYYLNGALLSEVTILAQVPDPTGSRIDAGEIGEELPYLYASGRYLGPEWLDATYEAGIEILFDAIRDRAGDGSSTP